ncbi:MAG: TlpA family protein disulfide reductase, partial [Bacteroidetes bacterium]|nr:TlpA family protein disulfide reductase [Bacteroidota bacterium]
MTFRILSSLFLVCQLSVISLAQVKIVSSIVQSGEEVRVIFNAEYSELKDAKIVKLIAYQFAKDELNASSFSMEEKNGSWETNFKVEEKYSGIIFKLVDEDETIENQKGSGYIIKIVDKNGKAVQGFHAGLADAYLSWGEYFLGIVSNEQKPMDEMNKEFELHPTSRNSYLGTYFETLNRAKGEAAKSEIIQELDQLEKSDELTKDELLLLVTWNSRLRRMDRVMKFSDMIKERDPEGEFVQNDLFRKLSIEKDISIKLEMFDDFKMKYPDSRFLTPMLLSISRELFKSGQSEKISQLILDNSEKLNFDFYSSAAKFLYENDGDLNVALEYLKSAEIHARKDLEGEGQKKPSYLTDEQWKDENLEKIGKTFELTGKIKLMLGQKVDALEQFSKGVEITKGKSTSLNELLIESLFEMNQHSIAERKLVEFIPKGKSTVKMKMIYKSLLSEKGMEEKAVNKQLNDLEEKVLLKLRHELEPKVLNSPAAEFVLDDLAGDKVSSKEFSGKVVVLDFWATWCGPCLQSFPSITQAVEYFKNDQEIQFLFVNSWERVEDKKSNAIEFIEKNKYPFKVLLDVDNKVISDYRVEGIPTKFVIGKDGKIKFKSVGFDGDGAKMVDELRVMIEMSR